MSFEVTHDRFHRLANRRLIAVSIASVIGNLAFGIFLLWRYRFGQMYAFCEPSGWTANHVTMTSASSGPRGVIRSESFLNPLSAGFLTTIPRSSPVASLYARSPRWSSACWSMGRRPWFNCTRNQDFSYGSFSFLVALT